MKDVHSVKRANIAASIILCIGLTRMIGYSIDSKILQGLGAATGIAPFTKVFSTHHGYEAFTASLILEGQLADGHWESIPLTPELYAKLTGCYMRRNVYGAAIVFAPGLPEAIREALHAQILKPENPLRRELAIGFGPQEENRWRQARLIVQPRPDAGGSLPPAFSYALPCQ